jgi:NAD-dependent dihydropyrimidine dehydrogenase PreA subunit
MQKTQKFHHKRKENINSVQEHAFIGFLGYRSAVRVPVLQVHNKELRTNKHESGCISCGDCILICL